MTQPHNAERLANGSSRRYAVLMGIPDFMRADKDIAQFLGWSEPEPETGYCWFNAPLTVGGVVEQGLTLHGGCYKNIPEAHVTFEISATKPGQRRKLALARIDWKSLSGGHSNPVRPGSPVSGLRCSPSHHHAFELNWLESEQRMREGNLPMAEDVFQDIETFEELRWRAGFLFRIKNMEIVSPPKWEYDMFQNV